MTRPTEAPIRLLLRPQEAANSLGVSLRCLMAWVAAGEVPAVRLGERCLRFSVEALKAWVASRSTWPTRISLGVEQSSSSSGILGAVGAGTANCAAGRASG